jgi:ribosomal protein S18 acetylase RimI-like enzyme
MTDEEYLSYHDSSVAILADEEVKAFGFDPDDAHQRALAAFERLIPNKILSTSQQHIYVIECESVSVGVMWYESRNSNRDAYIYDLLIWPSYRRRGYATTALRMLEKKFHSSNSKIFLNVFNHNIEAQSFYKSLGYTVRSCLLMKTTEPSQS